MKGIGDSRPSVVGFEPTVVRVGKFAAKARTGSSFTTIDGSIYQVVSHVEGAGVTRFKLAKSDGTVITATQNEINRLIPLSPALAKFAALLRWAVSNSTDDIIKEAIRHAGLPVDQNINWNSWFRHAYYGKMKADPSMVEESIQQLLFKYLYENDMLRKNFDKERLQPGESLETAITKYLKYLFTNKYSEAQSYIEKQTGTERKQRNVKDEGGQRIQEKNPSGQPLFWTGSGRGRQKTVRTTDAKGQPLSPVYVKEKVEDAPHLESEVREGEEGEYSLFDQMTSPAAASAFELVVKDDDLRKLRASFFAYVKDELKQRDQTAASALLAFDLAVESEEGRPSDWVEEWTSGTGLSPSSQKVTLKKLGDWLLQFVKDYPEYEGSHAFVKLIVDMVRKQENQTKASAVTKIPAYKLMGALHLASTYEDGTNHPPLIEASDDFEPLEKEGASDEEVQQNYMDRKQKQEGNKALAAIKKDVRNRIENQFDSVGFSAKGQCFIVKQGYFYTHGMDEDKIAAKLLRILPEAIVVDKRNHWNAWPKNSWFEVRFKMPAQSAAAKEDTAKAMGLPSAVPGAAGVDQKGDVIPADNNTGTKASSDKEGSDMKQAGKHQFQHDADVAVFQVLNGGFSQLWGNYGHREGYNVPSTLIRTAKFFEENGKPEVASIFREAAKIDGDDSEYDDENYEEYSTQWDDLESRFYDMWNNDKSVEALFPDEEDEAAPAAAPAIYPSDADDAKAISEIENEDEKKSSTPEFTGHYEAADEEKEDCEGCGKRRVCNDGGTCHECSKSKEGSMNNKKAENAITIPVKQQALLPDNAAWTNRFQVRSESSDALYTIAQNKSGGWWGCSCPGWIRHKNCKHLRALGLPGNHQPAQAQLQRAQSTSPFPQKSSQEGGMKLDKNSKVNQKKADYTKFRAVVAAKPQDVQAALEEFRDTFAMMASKTDAMLKNLGLKAAAEDAPLKDKIAAKRSFASGLKKVADDMPGSFVEALGQMYQQLDDVADGIEAVAENLGVDLPTVSPEPMDISDPGMVDPDMAPAGDITEGTQDAAQTLTPDAPPAAMPADANAMPAAI